MKSHLLTFVLATCQLFTLATADASTKAIGFILGNPTAVVGQIQMSEKNSAQMGLAFSFDDSILVYGDYLFHYPGMITASEPLIRSLTPYFGVGGAVAVTTDDRRDKDGYFDKESGSVGMGVRIPLGIEWKGQNPPLRVYLELAPGISIFPETSAEFMGGIGLKYWFN